MTIPFHSDVEQRATEAKLWCSLQQAKQEQFRSAKLHPESSLFQAFKSGISSGVPPLKVESALAEKVAIRRRIELQQIQGAVIGDGQLLFVDLSSCMYDCIASEETDGFFDESDAPPWDMWIAVCEIENVAGLLSWIPSECTEIVRDAMRFNDVIHWVASDCIKLAKQI